MKFRDWNADMSELQWKLIDYKTQADTFIEWCFEQKCIGLAQGNDIVNEWRARKQTYISYLSTIFFDFQHYSQHDVSHSINILNYIELLIGRNRVKLLSASDLWLLLETAYFHDIGMALTYEEMSKIWKSQEFRAYLQKVLEGNDIDLAEAAEYYEKMNSLLSERGSGSTIKKLEFPPEWPLVFQRNIMILMSDYVRREHPQRSHRFMIANEEKFAGSGVIKERMNRLIGEISELHGGSFSEIEKKVANCAVGFGTDRMYPQFVAAMLRLGDLLDMDNNRFNVRAIEHFGRLPALSGFHYEKHRAIYHFSITPTMIEASASSGDYKVCQEISKWFQYLKEEVENISCDWNRFAPPLLKGCELQRCRLDIYFGDTKFDARWQKSYEVDQKRLINLMTGYNIYSSKLDCLREYIQNAMDATKMRLWSDIRSGRTKLIQNGIDKTKLTPFDISAESYQMRAIEVDISIILEKSDKSTSSKDTGDSGGIELDEPKEPYVCIRISDRGVGMEKECVDSLAVVGRSWKGRTAYQNEISQMPDWLKPTGGFGIGLQSAFMLTRQVKIYTRSTNEAEGYIVKLDSPREGGAILKMHKKKERAGTDICFYIPLELLYTAIREEEWYGLNEYLKEHSDSRVKDCDGFSKENSEDYIKDFFAYYVSKKIVNPLFPIRITGGRKEETEYSSPFASDKNGFGIWTNTFMLHDRYVCSISENLEARIWDQEKQVFLYAKEHNCNPIQFDIQTGRTRNHFCYKGVKVEDIKEQERGIEYNYFFDTCVDIMGGKMEDVLSVRRNDFAQNFPVEIYYRECLAVYVEAVYRKIKDSPDRKWKDRDKINSILSVFQYLLLAIQVLKRETLEDVLSYFIDIMENPQQITIWRIENDKVVPGSKETKEALRKLKSIFTKNIDEGQGTLFVVAKEPLPPPDTIPIIPLREMASLLTEDRQYVTELVQELKAAGEIYSNPDICYALLNLGKRFDIKHFKISGDRQDLVYARIRGLDEDWEYQKQGHLDEKKFVRDAFWMSKETRYIAQNVTCKKYDDLRVDILPSDCQKKISTERRAVYLISPVSCSACINMLLLMGLDADRPDGDAKAKMVRLVSREAFITCITEKPEYSYLCFWVYRHQMNKGNSRLEIGQIDEKYKKMLAEMYEENFEW
ncbi:MAG: hypothetical protein ACLU9Q_09775 [Marvinbryantia sp.]|uniref:HD domain-containing protein n=1 Tax=Marvinbryantia sp. TaxID=2496532 RepID=UPI00399A9108